MDTLSATVPVNPLRGVILIVELPLAPAFADGFVGFAETVKSGDDDWTVTETLVEWVREPLDPVTVTL